MSARTGRKLQLRRPSKATILASAGTDYAAGEPVWASDTGELFVADGTNLPAVVSRSFNGCGNVPSGNLVMPWNVISTAAAAPPTSQLGLFPVDVWPAPLTIKALACSVTTAQVGGTGTLNQAVLYRDNGTGAGPLVTAAGLLANVAVTATSPGIKLTALPANLTLTPGRYWTGLLYYQGTTAPTTVPQFTCVASSATLWCPSTAFQVQRGLYRSGISSVPTDGTAFTPNTSATAPIVALQAA